MYKVVICDDEAIICDGLKRLVKWEEYGFEVQECFYNGSDTIQYLDAHDIDVLVTDIQLPDITGLQIAEYLFEHNRKTKVILISGYKSFEYAQQAMAYGITDYITKPIKFSRFHMILDQFRQQLQLSSPTEHREGNTGDDLFELLPLLQTQFFTDLISGVLVDEAEIGRRIQLLKLSLSYNSNRCCLIELNPSDYQNYISHYWKYGSETFKNAIYNFYQGETSGIQYQVLISNINTWYVFAYQCNKSSIPITSLSHFKKAIEDYLTSQNDLLYNLLSLKMVYSIRYLEASVSDFIEKRKPHHEPINVSFITDEYQKKLSQLQELFLTYLNANDDKAIISLIDNYFYLLEDLTLAKQSYFVTELMSILLVRYRENGIYFYSFFEDLNVFEFLHQSNTLSGLKSLTKNVLLHIANKLKETSGKNSSEIIQKALHYIKKNYNSDLTLEDVASHVYLSSSYFSQFFRTNMGITFSDYVIRLRMDEACKLFKDTNKKVQEVSAIVGYQNSKYFSRLFKRYTGVTPSEYQYQLLSLGESYET